MAAITNEDLTLSIPREFYEVDNYDHSNRLLKGIYIRQEDGSFKRARMANIKNGNIFKMVNSLNDNEETETTLYRAFRDALYSKKMNNVVIYATTLEEYENEINLKPYIFEEPKDDPCRKETL